MGTDGGRSRSFFTSRRGVSGTTLKEGGGPRRFERETLQRGPRYGEAEPLLPRSQRVWGLRLQPSRGGELIAPHALGDTRRQPASARHRAGRVPPPTGSTKRGSALAPSAPAPTHPSIAEQDRARAAGQGPRTGRLRENGGLACTETAERCRVPRSAPRPAPLPRTRRLSAHAPCAPVKLLPSAARAEPALEAARTCPAWGGGREQQRRQRSVPHTSPAVPLLPALPQRRFGRAREVATGQRGASWGQRALLSPWAFPAAPPGPQLSRRTPPVDGREFPRLVPALPSGGNPALLLRENVQRNPGTPAHPALARSSPRREPGPHRSLPRKQPVDCN